MDDLLFEPAGRCAELIRDGELSPVELIGLVLSRIDACDPVLKAFVSVNHDLAVDEARAAEADVMSGRPLGPLHGVPYTVKDNIDVRGHVSTLGLKSFSEDPATADSPTVRLARAAGAICVGKTTLPELGWDSATETPRNGITRNPWDPTRSAGGSSGGSGAALAMGMAPLSIATDGGGSIRQPAAFNGVVGFKPSAGLVPIYPPSRFGALGHYGPMARSVDDIALFLDVIAGVDVRVEESLDRGFRSACDGDLNGCRVGYSPSVNGHAVDAEVVAAVESWLDVLRDAGAETEPFDFRVAGLEDTWDTLYQGATAKAFAGLPAHAKTELSAEFAEFIETARKIGEDACVTAEIRRHEIVREVYRQTRHFDLVVTPTTSTTAFPADRRARAETTERTHARADLLRLTQIWNLTGQPAMAVRAGWSETGLPIGVQIAGHIGRDALVLRAAGVGDRSLPFRRPPRPDGPNR